MLGRRWRRRANIGITLGQRLMFAGYATLWWLLWVENAQFKSQPVISLCHTQLLICIQENKMYYIPYSYYANYIFLPHVSLYFNAVSSIYSCKRQMVLNLSVAFVFENQLHLPILIHARLCAGMMCFLTLRLEVWRKCTIPYLYLKVWNYSIIDNN